MTSSFSFDATVSAASPTPSVPTTAPPRLLQGLRDLIPAYDGFVIDLWGVMHNGITPFPAAVEFLRTARAAGKKVAFLSNSSSIAAHVGAQLRQMGITDYDALITSGSLIAAALQTEHRAARALLIGGQEIFRQYQAPLTLVDEPAQADIIINAWYGEDEAAIAEWQQAMRQWHELALPMLCCNPDYVALTGDTPILCPGALAQAYEKLGGSVQYFGKPHRPAFTAAVQALELPNTARIAMIGDNLKTDIAGGVAYGLDTILVLDGVHGDDLPHDAKTIPAALTALFTAHGLFPTFAVPCLRV
jgi:HAD superfamily hydrolase (TIGR01459 family)